MKTRYIFALLLGAAALSSCATLGQVDTERVPPEQDTRDLFPRASSSRFVVIGTVVDSQGISQRMTPELIERVKAERDLSLTLGGSLYTIRVESTICRQADFKAGVHNSADAPRTVYLFLPRNEASFVDGHAREILLPERRYLLFLSAVASDVRQTWIRSFQLDPGYDYYRGEGLSRGVVPLFRQIGKDFAPAQSPVLEKVTKLCQAVRPSNVQEKLIALKRLAASDDPILQKEAEDAATALQAKQPKE